jgi:chloride channel protein, CIC family
LSSVDHERAMIWLMKDMRSHFLYASRVGILGMVTGAAVGAVCGGFLDVLRDANEGRAALISALAGAPIPGWLAMAAAGCMAGTLAAWLARHFSPFAPQFGDLSPPRGRAPRPIVSILVDVAGTALAIVGGLLVGPERPAMRIGAAVADLSQRLVPLAREDMRLIRNAASGAGIAAVFGAPLGCAAYTVEALVRRVDFRITLFTLGAGIAAATVARTIAGVKFPATGFALGSASQLADLLLFLALGAVIALLGALKVAILGPVLRLAGRTPVLIRAPVIGAFIGAAAWAMPLAAGPGTEAAAAALDGAPPPSMAASLIALRLLLGAFSIAAGAPGGFFTPAMALGALTGMLVGDAAGALNFAGSYAGAFVVAGMAASLASAARAPFTGVLLVVEFTGMPQFLLPAAMAVFGTALVTYGLETPALPVLLRAARLYALNRFKPCDAGAPGLVAADPARFRSLRSS